MEAMPTPSLRRITRTTSQFPPPLLLMPKFSHLIFLPTPPRPPRRPASMYPPSISTPPSPSSPPSSTLPSSPPLLPPASSSPSTPSTPRTVLPTCGEASSSKSPSPGRDTRTRSLGRAMRRRWGQGRRRRGGTRGGKWWSGMGGNTMRGG
jgi:hypothetical protein